MPGSWVTTVVSVINMAGGSINVVKSELQGRVGSPGEPPEYSWTKANVTTVENTVGVPDNFGAAQSTKSLGVLQCSDDISTPPNSFQKARGTFQWGNAPFTPLWDHEIALNTGIYNSKARGGHGVAPRQFAHVIDGLSNTIMFGEGMRRCDANPNSANGTTGRFRYAFLPSAVAEEHVHATAVPAARRDNAV